MLIPMASTTAEGHLLPAVFAIATAIPVLIVAWILAFSAARIGTFYGKIKIIQKILYRIVGILFILIGIYYGYILYF